MFRHEPQRPGIRRNGRAALDEKAAKRSGRGPTRSSDYLPSPLSEASDEASTGALDSRLSETVKSLLLGGEVR